MVEGAARLALQPRDLALLGLDVGEQRGEVAVGERLVLIGLDQRAVAIEQVALREAQLAAVARRLDDRRKVLQQRVLEREPDRLPQPQALLAVLLARPVSDLAAALLGPVLGDLLDRLLDRGEAGRVGARLALPRSRNSGRGQIRCARMTTGYCCQQ